ncbi:hypothetical protein C7387_4329 [Yokenella regensburgei]|uniref:Uncharacterized protein n=1 Tax=Yokenella regensburgei TaxID=158877 RepID=A0ABX9RWF8_9ENTR|nr:hypothetical protein C7387_4329 [Yokenella regensburgei]VFS16113.1 Uncharacterised protein [Yokenella regensburgei]
MVTTRFEEIFVVAEKAGKCEVCGKQCKRREKFSQTLNPFNKNKDGSVKTYQEIKKEVQQRAIDWRLGSLKHVKCEKAA